jgi:hypothetical protein
MPKTYEVEKFYLVEGNEESVSRSLEIIQNKLDSGFYEKLGCSIPDEIIPVVCDDENWSTEFKDNSLDLIVSNGQMHWVNELEGCMRSM